MRINQLAKELGVGNNDILDVVEKRLGLSGKSHSSSLDEDQIAQVRRSLGAKGAAHPAPKAPAKAPASAPAIKVTKAPKLEKAPAHPAPEPPRSSRKSPPPSSFGRRKPASRLPLRRNRRLLPRSAPPRSTLPKSARPRRLTCLPPSSRRLRPPTRASAASASRTRLRPLR